jgi:predicted dehydrogenase
MERRDLLKSAAASAIGLTILKSGVLRGQNAPSNRLNIALVGVWGRGTVHYNVLRNENVVALCDTNDLRIKEALPIFPKAKTYWDWRKCLDQKDVEAVLICAADHHHAFIANWAINRGIHVYCEKPLGICVDEVRTVRANYLKNKNKVVTQHGTQRHAYANFQRLRELVMDGAIGELHTVSGWDSRHLPRPGYPPGQGQPPSFLHYEQWIGPTPYHPYTPQYFGGSAGANCQFWNPYRDFGVGQMGDMGAHTMDLIWNVIDAGAPTSLEVDQEVSDKYDPNINPVQLKVTSQHAKNNWRGPITLVWYQGGLKPNQPRNFIDVTRIPNGAIFEGTKGMILADFNNRLIIPDNDNGNLTYYKHRTEEQLLPLIGGIGEPSPPSSGPPSARSGARAGRGGPQGGRGGGSAPALPPGFTAMPNYTVNGPDGFPVVQFLEGGIPAGLGLPNTEVQAILDAEKSGRLPPAGRDVFQKEWIDACKGKYNGVTHGTSSKTHCDFDYAGTMMELMMLGLVAHRAGKKLEYDPATGRVTNAPEANDYLKREYRPTWTLNG